MPLDRKKLEELKRIAIWFRDAQARIAVPGYFWHDDETAAVREGLPALIAEVERLLEAAGTLAVRWLREAGNWDKPMGDPAEIRERRAISGTLCRCVRELCAALALPSAHPASAPPNAPGAPGDEALAKSDVASDSSSPVPDPAE